MKWRFRLLPTIIFCAAFTLSLKLGGLWQGVDALVSPSSAVAEEKDERKGENGQPPAAAGDAKEPTGKAGNQEKPAGAAQLAKTQGVRFDPRLVTDSELDVLQKLAERRAELNDRSRQLDTREKVLRATEARIEAKIVDLKQIQDTISKLLAKHEKEKEEQLRSVVKIYEKMKPKDAARIFEELEMPILLDVVERMREAKTAPIMANMSPLKAKAITAALAQRRALPKLDKKEIN
jgi:flagellar motility protein MotE (MotC chaperone)